MRDKVIALARQIADPEKVDPVCRDGLFVTLTPEELTRFYQLARADMKEQCAKVCEEAIEELLLSMSNKDLVGLTIALRDAIRALEDV